MNEYLTLFEDLPFAFDSKNNIMEDKELGICGPIASVLTPESSPFVMKSLQACP